MFTDRQKIGVGLTGFGIFFTVLGVLLLFDRGFLAMGTLLFLAGVTMTIGLAPTVKFFCRTRNRRGSAFYLCGAVMVLLKMPMLGLCVEAYGFWLLFAAFFPTALQFFRKVPVLSRVLDIPIIKTIINRVAPAGLPV